MIDKAKNLGTTKALKNTSASCIILNKMSSFMMNLLLTGGVFKVLCMCLQYISCYLRDLMLCVLMPKTFMESVSVESWALDIMASLSNNVCQDFCPLGL